jgi:hypothetical protein
MIDRDLLPYWPRQEDVNACITSEAEAASEWVALAVHQPMRFIPRIIGSAAPPLGDCDEDKLLHAFLTPDIPEGRVIVPIVGQSGVGKSHVIRWLDVQLRGRADANRRVVIRIPKGVSLREVLRLLLEQLPAERYGHYRDELERAQHELDSREASGLLCEMLAHVLEDMGMSAKKKLLLRPDDAELKDKEAYCSILPSLLRNQFLRDHHFLTSKSGGDGPVRRLVEHLTVAQNPSLDDARKHGFTAEDLDFGGLEADETLGRPERRAIAMLRPDRRSIAARILNQAIDDAKQRLLRIGPSTISDLFDSIRRDLLVDGKELVLLVEDFVVLSGLQKQLLQVIIKEAVRDGTQVLCTMRTAIAYTTGYLDADTVLTRAHIEYRIPDDSPSEEDIFIRVERLVGAYLNAARIGQDKLKEAYSSRDASGTLRSWIPIFNKQLETETRTTLDAFGKSLDGYELFPLNQNALRQLAREGCIRNNNFVYNPRFIIQNVLNAVLVYRALFESEKFPPASFGIRSTQVGASVVAQVRRMVTDDELDRHLRFLAYWAGGGGAGQVPRQVAEAFRIQINAIPGAGHTTLSSSVSHAKSAPSPSPHQAKEPTQSPPTATPTEMQRPQEETRWDGVLEQWRRGSTLVQRDANTIRRLVFDAARSSLDWDWCLHRPSLWESKWGEKQHERLYLPRANGGEGRTASDAAACICTTEDLNSEANSARIKLALMGLIRIKLIYKDNRSYDGVEKDLAAAGPLVERVAAGLQRHIQGSYTGVAWDPGPLLVEGLLIGARALGVEGAQRDDLADLSNALFEPAPATNPEGLSGTIWADYCAALAQCRGSGDEPSWRACLLDLLGARQGGANKVHAVDAARLKYLIEGVVKHWSHASQTPTNTVAGSDILEKIRPIYINLRRSAPAVDTETQALVAWRQRCINWMGAEFDQNEVLQLMKEAENAAHEAGLLAHAANRRPFNASIEAFRNSPVKAALEDVAKFKPNDRGSALILIGRRHAPTVRVTDGLMEAYDALERDLKDKLESARLTYGADPIAEAVAVLQAALLEAERSLGGLDGDNK